MKFKKAESDNFDLTSIDSDILIEQVEEVLADKTDKCQLESIHDHNDNSSSVTNKNVIDRFFIDSYDLMVYMSYQIFNLLVSVVLLCIFIFVKRSWSLALFMIGILSLHTPLVIHYAKNRGGSKAINDTYFIQSGLYYLILSVYSVIMNFFYGDSLAELLNLFIYSNVPTLLSICCFLMSTESIKYNRVRKQKGCEKIQCIPTVSSEMESDLESDLESDRIVCEPDSESKSSHESGVEPKVELESESGVESESDDILTLSSDSESNDSKSNNLESNNVDAVISAETSRD